MSSEGDRQNDQNADSRIGIIQTVQTPLGFFVLVVLVVEVILGMVIKSTTGTTQMIALIGFLFIIGSLIILVALLAVFRPEALRGDRPKMLTTAPFARQTFKVGDQVRIRLDFPEKNIITDDGVIAWDSKMGGYKGQPAIITDVEEDPRSYLLDVDNKKFRWAPQWIEPYQ